MFRTLWIAAALLAGIAPVFAHAQEKPMPRLYELRIYTTHPGRLDALVKRFRDHTRALFEKHGMTNHQYWIPTDPARRENTLIYVVSHASEEAAKKSWDAFRADPAWIAARDASEVDGRIVAKVESIYMSEVDFAALK